MKLRGKRVRLYREKISLLSCTTFIVNEAFFNCTHKSTSLFTQFYSSHNKTLFVKNNIPKLRPYVLLDKRWTPRIWEWKHRLAEDSSQYPAPCCCAYFRSASWWTKKCLSWAPARSSSRPGDEPNPSWANKSRTFLGFEGRRASPSAG